jgi:hypothetical protein
MNNGPKHYKTKKCDPQTMKKSDEDLYLAQEQRWLQVAKAADKHLEDLVPLHKDYDSFVGCALVLAGSG